MYKKNLVVTFLALLAIGLSQQSVAQSMDPNAIWPLCGRITENPPGGWQASDGCPSERFGDPGYNDAPLSATFGPRPLGSQSDRYDFHRGLDIATDEGTPFFAVTDGEVKIAGDHSSYYDPLVKVRHYRPGSTTCTDGGGCYNSYYLHISEWVVSVGDTVQKGQLLGYTGASSASGWEHLHFELRDAPDFDVFSGWSRDAVQPFHILPYSAPNNTNIVFDSVDASDPGAVVAEVSVTSNRYDLVSVEMAVFDSQGQEITQPGNTPNANDYHVLPPFYDMDTWNFEYSHKDSSAYPWESFGAGGENECPYYTDHGASYSAHVHMDAQVPGNPLEGLFNGVHITPSKYWLIGNKDYQLTLEFLNLQGPAACIEASAVFASGDITTNNWGDCGGPTNQPPVAAFVYNCTDLDCTFDGSGSTDSDGTITAWDWNFGDGSTGSGSLTSHTFSAGGDYTVTLTVTDDDGATDSTQQVVSVSEPPGPGISLALSADKKRNRINLSWDGASSSKVDIYRDSNKVVTTRNNGSWSDRNVNQGNTYVYKVCERDSTTVCSAEEAFTL